MSSWLLFGWPYFCVLQFCGPSENGQELGFGGEFCVRLGESVGVQIFTLFRRADVRNVVVATTTILENSREE